VALARGIATDPKLMMYDEPFAGLDPISLSHIVELIRYAEPGAGLTSIVVTYDVKEALKVASYVYMICDAWCSERATRARSEASEDPYVKQFLTTLSRRPGALHFPAPPLEKS